MLLGIADILVISERSFDAEKLYRAVLAQDPGNAIKVLDGVAKELPSSETGAKARKRVEEINVDPKMQAELDAAKALDRLKDQIHPLKRDKAKPKIEEFIQLDQEWLTTMTAEPVAPQGSANT